jgi:hypothetical protein
MPMSIGRICLCIILAALLGFFLMFCMPPPPKCLKIGSMPLAGIAGAKWHGPWVTLGTPLVRLLAAVVYFYLTVARFKISRAAEPNPRFCFFELPFR